MERLGGGEGKEPMVKVGREIGWRMRGRRQSKGSARRGARCSRRRLHRTEGAAGESAGGEAPLEGDAGEPAGREAPLEGDAGEPAGGEVPLEGAAGEPAGGEALLEGVQTAVAQEECGTLEECEEWRGG